MIADRDTSTTCGVCARSTAGYGYRPQGSKYKDSPILWVCDDDDCIKLAAGSYFMKQDEFDRFERIAANTGGDKRAGAYLSKIGITDLAQLTVEQRFELWREVVAGYRSKLKESMEEVVPF